MQNNYLPAGGAVGAGELEVSLVTLYTKQSSTHKRSFIRHYMQDKMKMISKIFWKQSASLRSKLFKNTRFRFWNVQCFTKRSPQPPTILISVGGIYFNDILKERFVISQIQENNFVVQMSHSF